MTARLQKTGLVLVGMPQGSRGSVDQQHAPSTPSVEILLHILGRCENETISLADRLVRCGSVAAFGRPTVNVCLEPLCRLEAPRAGMAAHGSVGVWRGGLRCGLAAPALAFGGASLACLGALFSLQMSQACGIALPTTKFPCPLRESAEKAGPRREDYCWR
jgi:hypothetical protein